MRYQFEGYELDTDRRELRRRGAFLAVEPKVFDLLAYLIANRERVVTKDDLLTAIWDGRIVSESAVTTRINAARTAIGDSGNEQRLLRTLPRKGFRFVGPVREEPGPAEAANAEGSAEPIPALPLPDKPSIAVLPLTYMSGEAERYFADGIAEDIITELSRFSGLFVIARNSSFQWRDKPVDVRHVGSVLGVRYILEGSIRTAAERVRINVQLIDAQTGAHRWAERYDRDIKDIFAVQDEVARTVASILAAHVSKAERERTLLKPPASWRAYDYFLRAADVYSDFHRLMQAPAIHEARRLLDECLAMEPGYARAHVLYSEIKISTWTLRLDDDHLNPAAIENAHWWAERAVQLDPNLPEAHAQLSYVRALARMPDALTPFERALQLNPNFTDRRCITILTSIGQPERAISVANAHLRVDPFALPIARGSLGVAYVMLKRYSEALEHLTEFVSQSPNHRPGRVWLTVAYAHLGRIEDARVQAEHVLRLDPDFVAAETFRRLTTIWPTEVVEDFVVGLRKAGLPVK